MNREIQEGSREGSFDNTTNSDQARSPRPSVSSNSDRATIDQKRIHDSRDSSWSEHSSNRDFGTDSPEPAMMRWTTALTGCVMNNCSRLFGYLASCLSSSDQSRNSDLLIWDLPPRKCAERACSIATHLLTLLSLTTVGAGVLGVGPEQYIFEDNAPILSAALRSSARYLLPIGVFVYSFIFSLDRRPPQLIQLFLDMAEVQAILTEEQNPTQVRNYENLSPTEEKRIREFACLLYDVINPNGPTGQWFYGRNQNGAIDPNVDRWEMMRRYDFGEEKKQMEKHSRDKDGEILKIIFAARKPLLKNHLNALREMIDALADAKEDYLSPVSGSFTNLMNRSDLCRWFTLLFITGTTVVAVMMSLNLSLIASLLLNRMMRFWGDGIDSEIKANNYVAAIIFVGPIPAGILALWAQLNAIPKFYGNYRKAVQDTCHNLGLISKPAEKKRVQSIRTADGRLLKWDSIYFDGLPRLLLRQIYRGEICYGLFHNPNYLHIRNSVNLTMFGLTIGLLIAQPAYLDKSLLILTAFSYFGAKLFTEIPNYLRKRERIETLRVPPEAKKLRIDRGHLVDDKLENDSKNRGDSNNPPLHSSEVSEIEMDRRFSINSGSRRSLSSHSGEENDDDESKSLLPKTGSENKFNFLNRKSSDKKSNNITLKNPVSEDSQNSDLEYRPLS